MLAESSTSSWRKSSSGIAGFWKTAGAARKMSAASRMEIEKAGLQESIHDSSVVSGFDGLRSSLIVFRFSEKMVSRLDRRALCRLS